MFFIKDQYATVWNVEQKERYSTVRITTSEKKQDGTYENSTWPWVSFIGKAHEKASTLTQKDRIKILSGKITNRYNEEKKVYWLNVAVFDFEPVESHTQSYGGSPTMSEQPKPPVRHATPFEEDIDDSQLPF